MFKRSYLSIIRKISKTVILGVVLLIISSLVLIAISIKNATNEAMDYAKESIGGEVYLSADMENMRIEMEKNMGTNIEDRREMIGGFERPSIYLEDAEKLANIKYVSDYSYTISAFANASDFEIIENTNQQFGDRFGPNQGGMPNMNFGDINISAINAFALLSDLKNSIITLKEGEAFDETSENSVIISYELATLNEFEVGDTITLININNESEVTLNIAGVYDTNQSDDNRGMINSSNTVYTNITTASQFLSEEQYNEGNYTVESVTYYLDNPENFEEFIKEANTLIDLTSKNLSLDINRTAYDQMTGPISSVGSFATTILIVVIISAVVIISLIINNGVKDRTYEIGVLLSLGETKMKIFMQILLELVIVGTTAFILSIGINSAVAGKLGDSLLEKQINTEQTTTENNFGRGMGMPNRENETNAEVIDTINVSASSKEYIIFFGIGYAIILLSMIIPTVNIVKYDPKTILTRRSA